MCLYNLRRMATKSAFQQARSNSAVATHGGQWIRVIEAEVERNRQIRLAEEAAQKKRREIDERKLGGRAYAR